MCSHEDGVICASAAGRMYVLARRRSDLCERRGTHVLALKHAAPRLRGLRLGLQTRAGHGPDGAHAKRCASPAVGKSSRASSAGDRLNLQQNFRKPDRVGRRGLFEPREDFSRLITYAFPRLFPRLVPRLFQSRY